MPDSLIKILVIEDNLDDQKAFCRRVDEHGLPYQYKTAHSIEEAQRIIDQTPFDVIILDGEVPDGTAFDLLGTIAHTPFIVTTRLGHEDIAIQALQQGAADYLLKDAEHNYLRLLPLTIERVLQQNQATQAEEREARLGHILEESLNEIYIFDAETLHFLQVNRGAQQNLGYSFDEIQSLTPIDLKPEFTAETFAQLVEPLRRGTQEKMDFTTVHRRKDGSLYPVEVHLQLSIWEMSTVFVAIILDITKRRQAEEALNESEFKYRQLVELAQEGIWVIDQDAHTTFVNASMARMLGYTPEEMQNKHLFSFMDEQGKVLAKESLARREEGIMEQHEFEFIHKDGRRIFTLIETAPLTDEDGTYLGAIAGIVDITERKHIEQALQASEERYRTLVENQPHLVCQFTPDGTLTYVNRTYADYFGRPVEALQGHNLFDLIPEQDRQALRTHLDDMGPNNLVSKIEHQVRLATGEVRWQEWTDQAFLDADGKVVEFQSVGRDVTDRTHAKEALKQQKELLQTIFDHIPLMIALFNEEGRPQLVNRAFEQILGWTFEEAQNHPDFWAACYPDPIERQRAIDSLKSQPHVWHDFKTTTRSGQVIDTSWANVFLSSGTNIGIGQDITEQKQAIEALQASEQRNRALLDGIPDMMFRLRADGTFLDYKAESIEELAIPSEAIIGSSLFQSPIPAPVTEEIMRCMQEALTTNEVQTYEYELAVPIGVQAYEARIVRSGLKEVVSIVRNVTERKHAEAEQERLIAELEARNAELGRFTYTVSHDLKSPLVTIKGFAGLLLKDVASGHEEALARNVEHISNAADTMVRLLNELLELSRIGRVINPSEDVSLTELAHEAKKLVTDQIAERGVVLDIAPDLPIVFGDKTRLLEVFQNLIENAIKFMGTQTEPHIKIGSRKTNEGLVCYVQDNGIGINPSYHAQVFGLFNRLNHDVPGTGIGLALIKRIVEVHGGRIWVESEGEGHGSTFCFILPV